MIDVVRWFNVAAALVVIAAGTVQIRQWRTFRPAERLHWQSTALFNLTALIGSLESLRGHLAGGSRVYLLAVALTWLLAAVLHRPYARWRARRRTHEESP